LNRRFFSVRDDKGRTRAEPALALSILLPELIIPLVTP
jgi:hypothetical protein